MFSFLCLDTGGTRKGTRATLSDPQNETRLSIRQLGYYQAVAEWAKLARKSRCRFPFAH